MGIAAFRRLAREVSKPAAWILFCVCATEIFIFLFGPSTVPLPSFTNMTELEWMIDAHLQGNDLLYNVSAGVYVHGCGCLRVACLSYIQVYLYITGVYDSFIDNARACTHVMTPYTSLFFRFIVCLAVCLSVCLSHSLSSSLSLIMC